MFTLDECRAILKVMPTTFDSHEFIRVGALIATPSFLNLLRMYHADFQIINSQIGSFLMRHVISNELEIEKIDEHDSETIVGTTSKCAVWNKRNI